MKNINKHSKGTSKEKNELEPLRAMISMFSMTKDLTETSVG